jgi:hypothetical protein
MTLILAAAPARASAPRLESVEPTGGQRGSTVALSLRGDRLDRLREVLFLNPGLRATQVEPIDSNTARITVAIDPDCPLGEHPYLVRGDQGLTAWRTFWVGPYPERAEAEPNNQLEEAEAISRSATILGTLTEADQDCFSVRLEQGARLSVEVVGLRLGGRFIDPHLSLVDDLGKTLLEVDDTGLLRQDCGATFVAPQSGRYLIILRDSAYGGDADARYRLVVGDHIQPLAAYPPGGQAEETLELTVLGDALGPQRLKVPLPATWPFSRNWPCFISSNSPTPLPLRVQPWPSLLEQEPNNQDDPEAEPVGLAPVALNGILQTPGDRDVWKVRCPAGEAFEVETHASRLGVAIDPVLTIRDSEGRIVAWNDDGALGDSRCRFRAPVDGNYFIEIRDQLLRGHPSAVYRVEITPVSPQLSLAVPIENPVTQEGQTLLVARENRAAMLVAVRREGFQGPVDLEWDGLPDGLKARLAGPIEEGQYLTPLVLEAAADAPLGARLVRLTGRGRESREQGAEVVGGLQQDIGVTFGPPNNTIYHRLTVDRFPIAVVEALPLRLEVAPPLAPLVQDGRIDLKVKALRSPGFTEAIDLTLLYQPPWIEEPEVKEIPEGETEVTFPLLAARSAAARRWQVVIAGKTRVDGGKVQVVSAPFELRVVPPSCSLTIEPAATQPGVNVEVTCRLEVKTPFAGKGRLRLLGLPKHATAPDQEVDAGSSRVVFPVTVGRDTPPAIHNTLYGELTTYENGEPTIAYLGRGGVLEVDPQAGRRSDATSRLDALRKAKSDRPTAAPPR